MRVVVGDVETTGGGRGERCELGGNFQPIASRGPRRIKLSKRWACDHNCLALARRFWLPSIQEINSSAAMPEPLTTPFSHWPKIAVGSAVLYGAPMGLLYSYLSGKWSGMIAGLVAGAFFGLFMSVTMAWFNRRQTGRFQKQRPDFASEDVALEGPANHVMGVEAVGGYLWLTSARLHFVSHKHNIQNHEWTAPTTEIASAAPAKMLGLFNTALIVRLKSGEEHRFVVNHNARWVAAIEALDTHAYQVADHPLQASN